MPESPYAIVDVFTENAFSGNPLAVVTDGRGLSGQAMQDLAAEFNFSETAIVLPPEDPANDAAVRIFNRKHEMPFAGHPNIGTAFVLGRMGALFGETLGPVLRFEEKAGLVEARLIEDEGTVVGARIEAPQRLETWDGLARPIVADALGVAPERVLDQAHPPIFASVGLPFLVAELDPQGLAQASADIARFARARSAMTPEPANGRLGIYAYAKDADGHIEARMFSPLVGTTEDPATGSAASALGGLLATLAPERHGDFRFAIAQGKRIGRPSALVVEAVKKNGAVAAIHLEGRCCAVMRGVITL